MAKMSKRMAIFEKMDKASDKKAGVKEGSKADMAKDKKMPPWLQKTTKAADGGMMGNSNRPAGAGPGMNAKRPMRMEPKNTGGPARAYRKGGSVKGKSC